MAKETFRYKVTLRYVMENNDEIIIDSNQISYVAVDKDFDNNNMPVIAIVASIEKDVLDDMIRHVNDNILTLGIYRYDVNNQTDNITKKCIHDRFIYILPDDISKTAVIDYPNGEGKEGLYKDVTLWLLPQDAVNNNKQTINGVFKNATMNTMILNSTNYLGKMLLEPIKYDNKYDQVIIPPQNSISEYISFLNNDLSVFYDTPYRFFIDFDMTYIVSSSGHVVRSKNESIFTFDIQISSIIPQEEDDTGMYIDKRNNKNVIYVNSANVNYTRNNITNKMVNSITTIDSSGNVYRRDVESNNTKVTKKLSTIINLSNTDNNAVNNIVSSISMNNVCVSIVKNDLDANVFTMNKEYIITDNTHPEFNGRYLISSVKQMYTKQTEQFVMATILNLKKI